MSDEPVFCGKVRYATENEARQALRRIAAEYPKSRTAGRRVKRRPMAHYPCENCGGFHLTSKKRRFKA